MIGPIVIAYILSVTVEPVLIARYLIFVVPATIAITAAVFLRLPMPPLLRWGVLAAMLATTAVPAVHAVHDSRTHSDWRALVAAWRELKEPADDLMFFRGGGVNPFRYYYRAKIKPLRSPRNMEQALQPVDVPGRLWIALRSANREISDAIVAAYIQADYEHLQTLHFHGLQLIELKRR